MAPFRKSSSRVNLEHWVERAAASVPLGSLVLDAGAGESPYAGLFAGHRYESADFAQVEKEYASDLTYVCDLTQLPVEDARFDLIIMTQVLEHLPAPAHVLAEMRRVLKPGAELWYSTPLFYEEHEQPFDFYRYTQFAHRHLCAETGFELVSVEWLEGYLATLAYQVSMAASSLPTGVGTHGRRVKGAICSGLTGGLRRSLRLVARQLDQLDQQRKITSVGMPKNYCVRARRPLVGP